MRDVERPVRGRRRGPWAFCARRLSFMHSLSHAVPVSCNAGMVHANGYGHLLRVNGLQGQGPGSPRSITGRDVMAIWSALCLRLDVTAISTEDVSNKVG